MKEKSSLETIRASKGDLIIKTQSTKTKKLLHEKRESFKDLEHLERMWDIQDKWQLIAWGMR